MAIRLTSAADYAVRSMIHIASFPGGSRVQRSDIARVQKIPSSFISKVLQSLVRAGLLRSSRGAGGGFSLSRPAGQINLLEIIEAIEGPLSLTECVPDPARCEHVSHCPANSVWMEVQERMAGILREADLDGLVSAQTHENNRQRQ